jgi:hypothetical protein
MRAASVLSNLRLSIVADFRGSRRISGILERLNPALCELVIPLGDGLETVLRIKVRIEAGEIVAVLADRADAYERALPATFLGGTARFPVGPYLLAATLGCPVLLTFGLYKTPNQYEVHCKPFAQRITLPERHLDPGLRDCVSRYVARQLVQLLFLLEPSRRRLSGRRRSNDHDHDRARGMAEIVGAGRALTGLARRRRRSFDAAEKVCLRRLDRVPVFGRPQCYDEGHDRRGLEFASHAG